MRLYLSSFRLGNNPQRLVDLVRGNMKAAVIVNACDHYCDSERDARVKQEIDALGNLGLTAFELDLRRYFGKQEAGASLLSIIDKCGLLWIRGGNTFVLRRAMSESGFDQLVINFLGRDRLVYGGYSAAACVLAPSLKGVELVDDPHVVPIGYKPPVIWDGLGILPFAIAPHYRSDHPESADVERQVQYYLDHHCLFIALRDGEVIVVDGNLEELEKVSN